METDSILIVDDEIELLNMIRYIFERAGYEHVRTSASAKEALKIIKMENPSIVILDIMMPEMDGFELLQELRVFSQIPVLMLSAKGEAEDRFSGFELGADDYLTKPFLPKELLLRVSAILRRTNPPKNNLVFLHSSTIDLDKAEILRNDMRISLTAKEYSIIKALADNAGKIVAIGTLCQQCCGGEYWQGYEATLMTYIRHLRQKIECDPSHPISLITVKGLGYKLIIKEEQ
ncbi:response regulator transcription factor [Clostridium oryzae]|uniref:Stage 0 sporulation protein A homolog n=1 Tax=Clostridium oryzae TaxID=1450648 RepID=A0A1V4IXD7_9CLOT|nr:response regulator transcription factor [Clostridium oryzae]OPJ64616.1 transcriptional regulatory protein SrrA [Clostridium oryzae]